MSRTISPRGFLAWSFAPALGLLVIGAASAQVRGAVLVNESPSLPRGLYVRVWNETPRQGSIVALDQPDAVRPYLAHLGMPADVRLIKRVAAMPGDRVCAAPGQIRLPRRIARIRAADRHGRPLPAWQGCRSIGPDELFLLGDTPTSLDGRYFGPTRRADIDGVYREVLTW